MSGLHQVCPSKTNLMICIAIKWKSDSGEESATRRLSELFNVNHFILSQSQPYIAPFLDQGLRGNLKNNNLLSRLVRYTLSFLGKVDEFVDLQVLNFDSERHN